MVLIRVVLVIGIVLAILAFASYRISRTLKGSYSIACTTANHPVAHAISYQSGFSALYSNLIKSTN